MTNVLYSNLLVSKYILNTGFKHSTFAYRYAYIEYENAVSRK